MKLRFGVIGLAHGHIHGMVPALQRMDGLSLVALADADNGLRGDAVRRYKVKAYDDYREMLDKEPLDFVAICPPNCEKGKVIVDCAERGRHVIADKPLVTTLDVLDEVEKAVAKNSVKLSLLLTLRFSPGYYTLKKAVERGQVGEVVSIWATRPHKLSIKSRTEAMLNAKINGGVIVDLGIHDMDMARWVTRDEVQRVTAYHSNRRFKKECPFFYDNGHILARMKGGAVVYINPDWLTPDASEWHGDCRFYVVGTEGTVETDSVSGKVKLITNTEKPKMVPLETPPVSIYQDFLNQIADTSYKGIITNTDIFRSMRAVLTARDAADSGKTLTLES